MTSPYSTNLLQQPVESDRSEDASDRRRTHAPVRSVTHVVAQPHPQPAYAPMYAPPAAPARGGGALSSLVLALVVVLLGAVSLVGAYAATRGASPSDREAAVVEGIATRQAFRAGRERGIGMGRQQALEHATTTTALRTAIARQRAWAAAYRRGERAGRRSYRAPRYTGGSYGGYRAPRYGGYGNVQVAAALGQAQHLANLTGAPVDVEIY